MTSRATR